jgi:hypothetical protein
MMPKYKYIIGISLIVIIYLIYKQRTEGFLNNDTIHVYNKYHLGDCIFMMIYLHNIKDYLAAQKRHVHFYINPSYIKQVEEFIPNEYVKVRPLNEKPNNAHDVWMAHSFHLLDENRKDFLKFLKTHSNRLATDVLKMPTISKFLYDDPDLQTRYNRLDSTKYHDVDILIINSKPMSGQLEYNEEEWNTVIEDLNRLYKVVTTLKVGNISCTMDDKLSIKDIAAISTHAKNIIAINTGPLIGCFNNAAYNNVKKWYIFDTHYSFYDPTFKSVLDFNEIRRNFL